MIYNILLIMLLLLVQSCSSLSYAELIPGTSAQSRLLSLHPAFVGGGATGESFASWANCRYLLDDSLTVGKISLLDDGVSGLLFIAQGKTVLAFWSSDRQPATAHIDLLPGAFLHSRGNLTRKLAGKSAEIAASALPQFVVNCSHNYLRSGLNAEISKTSKEISPLLQQLLPEATFASWQGATKINQGFSPADTEKYLLQQKTVVDSMLSTLLQLPVTVDCNLRSDGTWKLLCWRLRLLELMTAFRELNGTIVNNASLSPLEEQAFMDGYLHYLAQAEAKTALRARPKSGMLLRNAMFEMQRLQSKKSSYMKESLLFVYQIIPYFISIESPVVQNITITAEVIEENDSEELLLIVYNNSAEKAEGWLELSWRGKANHSSFEIDTGKTATLHISPGDTADTAKNIQVTGALNDGTPLLPLFVTLQRK